MISTILNDVNSVAAQTRDNYWWAQIASTGDTSMTGNLIDRGGYSQPQLQARATAIVTRMRAAGQTPDAAALKKESLAKTVSLSAIEQSPLTRVLGLVAIGAALLTLVGD